VESNFIFDVGRIFPSGLNFNHNRSLFSKVLSSPVHVTECTFVDVSSLHVVDFWVGFFDDDSFSSLL